MNKDQVVEKCCRLSDEEPVMRIKQLSVRYDIILPVSEMQLNVVLPPELSKRYTPCRHWCDSHEVVEEPVYGSLYTLCDERSPGRLFQLHMLDLAGGLPGKITEQSEDGHNNCLHVHFDQT